MKMIAEINDMIDFNIKHMSHINNLTYQTREYLGVDQLRIILVDKFQSRYLALSSNIEYLKSYVNGGHVEYCPLVHNSKKIPLIFMLENLIEDQLRDASGPYIKMLRENSINNAFCISFESGYYRFFLEYSFVNSGRKIINKLFTEYNNLLLIAEDVFNKIAKSILTYYKMPAFPNTEQIFYETDYSKPLCTKHELIRLFNGDNVESGTVSHYNEKILSRLSKREIEVIIPYAKGFTAKLISIKLSVSPRTVEAHINNIKAKIGCRTKSEITALLLNKIRMLGVHN